MVDVLQLKLQVHDSLCVRAVVQKDGEMLLLDPNPGGVGPVFRIPASAVVKQVDTKVSASQEVGIDANYSYLWLKRDALVQRIELVKASEIHTPGTVPLTGEYWQPWLWVQRCDNEMWVYVNGQLAYTKHTDFDPQLNDQLPLPYIVWGQNTVRVRCRNDAKKPGAQKNPVHFWVRAHLMRTMPWPPITGVPPYPVGPAQKEYFTVDIFKDDYPEGDVLDQTYIVNY